jgi:hypothetical protein
MIRVCYDNTLRICDFDRWIQIFPSKCLFIKLMACLMMQK